MGNVRFGLPETRAREMTHAFGLKAAIETGTYLGDTAATLATLVPVVTTIERDRELALRAQQRFASVPQVEVVHGAACEQLPRLIKARTDPVLFWLDAHWFPKQSIDDLPQCSLVSELDALSGWAGIGNSVIMIDDMHLFDGAIVGDVRYRTDEWPSLQMVRDRCSELYDGACIIESHEDVLFVLPN